MTVISFDGRELILQKLCEYYIFLYNRKTNNIEKLKERIMARDK
jgi:hypothetical protein